MESTKDWSSYNTTIVGYGPTNADPRRGVFDDSKPTYKTVSFAADREYGPEEGWQWVRRKSQRKRQWKGTA